MKSILLLIILLASTDLFAQDEGVLEKVFEEFLDETNETSAVELIDFYRRNKINLNNCKASELAILPLISAIDAYNILFYIEKYPYLDLPSICDSSNINLEAEIILNQCTHLGKFSYKKYPISYRARNVSSLSEVQGFKNSNFAGNQLDLYQRIMYEGEDLFVGFLTNKDAGEKDIYDFYSGFVNYHSRNLNIIAGDFVPQFGLGGIFWQAFGFRKGSDVIAPVINFGNGIFPNRSSLDYQYFRGMAVEFTFPVTNLFLCKTSVFYANTNRSATIDSSFDTVSSVYTSGYFRTENELIKKNVLNEKSLGANIEIAYKNLMISYNFLFLNYSKFIESNSANSFFGREGILQSINLSYSKLNFALAAEFTVDANSHTMFKSGIQHKVRNVEFAVFYRNINPYFRSPFGFSLSEFSSPSNEEGFYTGISWQMFRKISLNFYADIYSTFHRTYFVPAKVKGIDLFLEGIYKINSNNGLMIRLRNEIKNEKIKNSENYSYIANKEKVSLRTELSSKISKYLNMRIRLEVNAISFGNFIPNESGLLGSIEVKYLPYKNLHFRARFTQYSTDSYESAIWLFEYISNGYLRNIGLSGEGSRSTFSVDYEPIRNIGLSLSYYTLSKNKASTIGSSYNTIQGNTQSEIVFQIDFKI